MSGVNIGGYNVDPVGDTQKNIVNPITKATGTNVKEKMKKVAPPTIKILTEELGRMQTAQEKADKEAAIQQEHIGRTRRGQQKLGMELEARAMGEAGPSAAESQLQMATDRNMRGALAMAASGRGNPALAAQAAGRQRAQMGQQAAAQATSLRAQEQQQAMAQYAALISDARSQELGVEAASLGREQLRAGINTSEANRMSAERNADRARRDAQNAAITGAVVDVGTAYATGGASVPATAVKYAAADGGGGGGGQEEIPVQQVALTGEQPQPGVGVIPNLGNMQTGPARSQTGALIAYGDEPAPQGMSLMGTAPQLQAMQGFAPPQQGGFAPPPQGGFQGTPEQMAYPQGQDPRIAQMMAMARASQMGRF